MTHEERESLLIVADHEKSVANYGQAETMLLELLASTNPANTEEVEDHARILNRLGNIAFRRGDYPLALDRHKLSLDLSSEFDDKRCLASALSGLGSVYAAMSEYVVALEYSSKALHLNEELSYEEGVATQLGNIANIYFNLSDYSKALEYNAKALERDEELGNMSGVARHLSNIGNVYLRYSNYAKALEFYQRSLSISEEIGDKLVIETSLGNIGIVYDHLSDYPKSLEYASRALSVSREIGNKAAIARNLGNIGVLCFCLGDYVNALEHFIEALNIDTELNNQSGVIRHSLNIGNVHRVLSNLTTALDYYTTSRTHAEQIGSKAQEAGAVAKIGIVYFELADYARSLEYLEKALSFHSEVGELDEVAQDMGNIGCVYEKMGDFDRALDFYSRSLTMYDELLKRSEAALMKANIGGLYMNVAWPKYDEKKAEQFLTECLATEKDLGIQSYETHQHLADLYERQGRLPEFALHIRAYLRIKEEIQSSEVQRNALALEHRRALDEREKATAIAKAVDDAKMSATTGLLHKVLPESVATRMIAGEAEIADYFPQVSILFADIAGFTPISADMPAIVVVRFLNYVFGEFDRIIKKHGCEKIKTIGDGYMAVCGAPVECAEHAERLASAALEMQQTISLPESIAEFMPSGVEFGIRIGLHTGSVVAGVIGEERFVYDIYSDAVNTAARMESHGEENRIHCSNDFYRHLQNRFAMTKNTDHGFVFEKRGEMEIKGKGMMRTYFLERA